MFALLVGSLALAVAPDLNDDTFESLCDAICQREEELAFLKIGWHESFYSAVNEARETNRPVLLWAMNGHPLGCT
jgi:hypothetical protein